MKRGLRLRLFIILSLFLVLCPLALAQTDLIFDRSVNHNSIIELNDTRYSVLIGSGNHSLVKLVSDDSTLLLEEGKCISIAYSTFCYKEYDEDQSIFANLSDRKPVIDIDRSIISKKLDV